MAAELKSMLQWIWLTQNQTDIFLALYKYWPKPASSIAKMIWMERTNAYKTLEVLVRQWYLAESNNQGIKHFYVPDKNVLRYRLNSEKEQLEKTEKMLPVIEAELSKLETNRVSAIPKIHFFEGKSWIKALFQDMLHFTLEKKYLVIKLFASNTLESQSRSWESLKDYAKEFFEKIDKYGIVIDAVLGNGILLLENVVQTSDSDELSKLPAWSSVTNIFVVWSVVYLIIFKEAPVGIKIESEEMSDVLHFLLKKALG